MTLWDPSTFPVKVFGHKQFPGPTGELVERVRPMSMFPPHPWGPWLYAKVFEERCAQLEGDLLEAGVGSGGTSFFFGLLLQQLGQERRVFSVDSFEGLPEPDRRKDNSCFVKGDYGEAALTASPLAALLGEDANPLLEAFKLNAKGLGLEDTVVPIKGFFDDVLPTLSPEQRFCFVHIDADIYSSVLCALEQLWDRVVPGGVVAIDDFFHPVQGPLRAAAEFFNDRGLEPVYHVAFPYSVFVVKEDWGRVERGVDGNAYSLDYLRADDLLVDAVRNSRKASRKDPRARANCERLLEVLTQPPYPGDIYDYWRALEQFWRAIDARPEDRQPPSETGERLEDVPIVG